MNEEEKTLSLDDVKFLLEKIYAAQQAGNYVFFSCSNYAARVLAMNGKVSENKEWDKKFEMETYAGDPMQEYNDCIAYLEKLVGEEDDN